MMMMMMMYVHILKQHIDVFVFCVFRFLVCFFSSTQSE